MTTLRVIAEDAVARTSSRARFGGLARYAGELTKALIEAAPPGCDVELLVARHPKSVVADLDGPLRAGWGDSVLSFS